MERYLSKHNFRVQNLTTFVARGGQSSQKPNVDKMGVKEAHTNSNLL